MATAEQRNAARAYLVKAHEYLASAEVNLAESRPTVAAADSIHAGICAKDAIALMLTGRTQRQRDHAASASELAQALGAHPQARQATRALRDLLATKSAVEYGVDLMPAPRALSSVRHARGLVALAEKIVRRGGVGR